jgi:2-polyprenyl-6-methoxyphenol hydroxylase-like FAD-dependent oxidoreductase
MPARGGHPPLDADVIVVGAGPVGMTLAGRVAQHGLRVLLLEQELQHLGQGSKALCMQRETLEIWDRLGVGEQVAARGIQWNIGRTFFRGRELFSVELPGSGSEHFPPFVNISQSEVEEMLLARLAQIDGLELRWGHRLTGIAQDADGVTLACEVDGERSSLRASYLVGTDGAHSSVRGAMGMGFPGHSHRDLFLICDIRATLPFPRERHFHFDPPWNPGRQVLVHPQPDETWRIDWQVPSGTDAEAERATGALDARIRAVVGEGTEYELAWMTAYRFHQRLVEHFRAGRVLLAGDAAHLMSPFGARGLNSGAADAENLSWKLAAVVRGDAADSLLDSYHHERRAAALENLAITDETMRFMVPHGRVRRLVRNAVLRGSTRFAVMRRAVNAGRLSEPFVYDASPVIAPPPPEPRDGMPRHGEVAPDAIITVAGNDATRLRHLLGADFLVLLACPGQPELAAGAAVRAARLAWPAPCRVAVVGATHPVRGATLLDDRDGTIARRYAVGGPTAWLIRPDGHLVGSVALRAKAAVDALPALQALGMGRPGPAQPARASSPVPSADRWGKHVDNPPPAT